MKTAVLLSALFALSAPAAMAQSSAAPAPAASVKGYDVQATTVGTLLDDPAAKAIIDKHLPDFSKNPQIEMARGMTLKDLQQFSPDTLSDQKLSLIQADLSKLPPKK